MCKGYSQVEGIELEETFSPVARLEAIRMFLAYSCYRNLKVYQMDVKYAFFNGKLEEEVYVERPKGFILSRKGGLCLQTQEGTLWSQTSPKGMVFKTR